MRLNSNGAASMLGEGLIGRRERRALGMPAFAECGAGRQVEVLLIDVSAQGCGLETPVELRPGEEIRLTVPDRPPIHARVCWYSMGKAGVLFFPGETGSAEPQSREQEREPYCGEALVRRLGGSNYKVRIFDVSPEGCKIELIETPRVGEHLLIKFDRLEPLDAEVCWVDGPMAGLRFGRPIYGAVYELLMQRLN